MLKVLYNNKIFSSKKFLTNKLINDKTYESSYVRNDNDFNLIDNYSSLENINAGKKMGNTLATSALLFKSKKNTKLHFKSLFKSTNELKVSPKNLTATKFSLILQVPIKGGFLAYSMGVCGLINTYIIQSKICEIFNNIKSKNSCSFLSSKTLLKIAYISSNTRLNLFAASRISSPIKRRERRKNTLLKEISTTYNFF